MSHQTISLTPAQRAIKSQATFTDMYSTKIATVTGDRLGIGVQMPEIRASQKQGNLQKTDTVMDLAIEGEGLFALT